MSKSYTSKKFVIVLLTVAAVVAGGAGAWSAQASHQQEIKKQKAAAQSAAEVQAQAQKEHITYKGVEGITALETLKTKHQVSVKTFSFGDLVEGIDGVMGKGPKYWTFYINGKMADVGASTYVAKASDTIEWKLEQQ